MADQKPLSASIISAQLAELKGWDGDIHKIQKTFTFQDFTGAIAFINALAPHAEELDHHPELFNVYDRVDVTLTTHDVDGVTALDFELARRLDSLATS